MSKLQDKKNKTREFNKKGIAAALDIIIKCQGNEQEVAKQINSVFVNQWQLFSAWKKWHKYYASSNGLKRTSPVK